MAGRPKTGNAILDSIGAQHCVELGCTAITLRAGDVLQSADDPELYAYFPVTAVLSLISTMSSGATTEVALVGREGMVGLSGVLAATFTTTTCVVSIGGQCLRTTTAALRHARATNSAVRGA